MRRIRKNIFKLMLIIILVLGMLGSSKKVEAVGFFDMIEEQANIFLSQGKDAAMSDENLASDQETSQMMTSLYNILFTIGTIASIAVGGVLGVNYMVSSAEDKAKVKESMIPYIIGTAVIFGSLMIWKFAVSILSKV